MLAAVGCWTAAVTKIPPLPCVGVVADKSRELFVVGTAHTPCRSAAEVAAVIRAVKPDVVMVELDQERLERLLTSPPSVELRYGGDFAAAARAASDIGAPIVLGDAKARDTMASLRAPGPVADWARVRRAARLALRWLRGEVNGCSLQIQSVDVPASLVEDPAKLLPLLAGLWWTILLTAAAAWTMPPAAAADGAPAAGSIASALTAVSTLGAAGALALGTRAYDVVLLSRDEVLSASSLRCLELAHGLQTGRLHRRRYVFSTDPGVLASAAPPCSDTTPFFTLRRPLARGETRRLILFEPRWLCLLDHVAASAAAATDATPEEAGTAARASGTADSRTTADLLVGATFGCVFAANRYYAPGASGVSRERVADVVVGSAGRRVRILKAEESRRPVTGARRLVVSIEGEEALRVDPASLQPTSGGYLAGKVTACDDTEMEDPAGRPEASASYDHDGDHQVPSTAAPLKVVSVVGLAHANGILDRCAGQGLRDETALARAALETAEWVGY